MKKIHTYILATSLLVACGKKNGGGGGDGGGGAPEPKNKEETGKGGQGGNDGGGPREDGSHPHGKLESPKNLRSITRDGKVELLWDQRDLEGLQGYYVYAMKKSDHDAKAKGKARYPAGADPQKGGIPRCGYNSPWFEAFGLRPSASQCVVRELPPGSAEKICASSAPCDAREGTTMASDKPCPWWAKCDAREATTRMEKLIGFVRCDEEEASPIPEDYGDYPPSVGDNLLRNYPIKFSLTYDRRAANQGRCTVSKLADGKTAIENGVSYVFFVMGDEANSMEYSQPTWTSNIISDTPSKDSAVDAPVKLGPRQYATITVDPSAKTATLNAAARSCDTEGSTACDLKAAPNTDSPTSYTIYISRGSPVADGAAPAIYISTAAGKGVQLYDRGPAPGARAEGDQAVGVPAYLAAGTWFLVEANSTYDFAVTQGTDVYYGKVHIGALTPPAGTDPSADHGIVISVILQPTANVRDY